MFYGRIHIDNANSSIFIFTVHNFRYTAKLGLKKVHLYLTGRKSATFEISGDGYYIGTTYSRSMLLYNLL